MRASISKFWLLLSGSKADQKQSSHSSSRSHALLGNESPHQRCYMECLNGQPENETATHQPIFKSMWGQTKIFAGCISGARNTSNVAV